jgi:ATP phosphoribosyltransferase
MTRPLRLALQKSGRLSDQCFSLLEACDLRFPASKAGRAIKSKAINFPLEILLVRDDDIPEYVKDGIVDIGIVGENLIKESAYDLKVLQKLDFGHCRLALAVPQGSSFNTIESLQGKKIATSYPNSTKEFLESNKIKADIHFISGSVEIAPSLGISDAICDLVGTGSTLIQNGLRELFEIYKSQAVLITQPVSSLEVNQILEKVLFRISSVQKGRNLKYLMLNCERRNLDNIKKVLKGLRSPTVLELADQNWLAVHSIVSEDGLWDLIENLKDCGAEGILVTQVEKMVD